MQEVSSEESGLPPSFPVARDSGYYANVSAVLLNAHPNQLKERGTRAPGMTLSSGDEITMSCPSGCVSIRPSLYLTKAEQSRRSRPLATLQADCTIHCDTAHVAQALQRRLYRAVGAALPGGSASTSLPTVTTEDAMEGIAKVGGFFRVVADIFCEEEVNPQTSDPEPPWDERTETFCVLDAADVSHAAELADLRSKRKLPLVPPFSPEGLAIRDDSTWVGITDGDGALLGMASIGIRVLPEGLQDTRVVTCMVNNETAADFRGAATSSSVDHHLFEIRNRYEEAVKQLADRDEADLPVTPISGLSMLDTPEMLQSFVRAYAGIIKSEIADPSSKVEVISLDALNGSHLVGASAALSALNQKREDGNRQFHMMPADS